MTNITRFGIVVATVLSSQSLFAQLPAPSLNLISPAGGQVGSEVAVTITGVELEESNNLLFSNSGITASQKVTAPDEIDPKGVPVPQQFLIKIADNVPPGIYEVRATGPYGTTNPRAFVVGNLKTIPKTGKHHNRDTAMELSVGTAVTGSVDVGAVDYYRFTAKKGQRLLLNCFGRRIDSRIDATLVIYDSDGTQLKHVRDVVGYDPVMEFIPPADGDYFIGVYDFEYNGGGEHFYQLSLGVGSHVSFVFPPVGTPGATEKFTIYGHHLVGATPVSGMAIANNTLEKLSVDIEMGDLSDVQEFDAATLESPSNTLFARKLYQFETPKGKSNPVAIGYATAPVTVETEPNDQGNKGQKVSAPCEFVGQFYPRGDQDVVLFDGKKGEVYWLELLSNQLGVSTDGHMLIEKITTNEKGEEKVSLVAEVDDGKPSANANNVHGYFDTSRSDPGYQLSVDADATFRVTVKDLFGNSNNDPRFTYRLLIRPRQPDFQLMTYPTPASPDKNKVSTTTTVLPRGGNTTITVGITRQHGFDGDIELFVEGLPSGATCRGAIANAKVNQVTLIISAPENATAWSGPIRVVGKAKIADREVTRQSRYSSFIWGTQNAGKQRPVCRLVNELTLAIPDRRKAPLSVRLGDGNGKLLETSRGGKLEIPIKVVRGEDVPGDLKMKMVGVTGINLKDVTIKGNDGKYPLELTDQKFPPGIHTVHLTGTAKHKYKGDAEKLKRVEEDLKRLDEIVKQVAVKAKQAGENLRKAQEAAGKDKTNQSLAEAVKKADGEVKRLASLSKRAQQRKQEVGKKLNDTKNKNKPRDINLPFVSTPIRLKFARLAAR